MRFSTIGVTCLFLLFYFSLSALSAQVLIGSEQVIIDEVTGTPSYVIFAEEEPLTIKKYEAWEKKVFAPSEGTEFEIVAETCGENGKIHQVRQQYYKGIPIEGALSVVHSKDGIVECFNGTIFPNVEVDLTNLIPGKEAKLTALTALNLHPMLWQHTQFSTKHLLIGNNLAKFEGESTRLVLKLEEDELVPVWEVGLNSFVLSLEEKVSVDAITRQATIADHESHGSHRNGVGTVIVRFYADMGFQIISTSYNSITQRFELRDSENRDFAAIHETETEIGDPIDFVSKINDNWNAGDVKPFATAFFGLQETFNTYANLFNRDGINQAPVYLQKVAQGTRYVKFFSSSDYYHVIKFRGNDTDESMHQNSVDIIAHEFSHGVAEVHGFEQTGNNENDGINEAFCDIMGKVVEWDFENRKYGIPFPDAESDDERWEVGRGVDLLSRSIKDPGLDMSVSTNNTQTGCCDDEDPESYDEECCADAMANAGTTFGSTPSPDTYGVDNSCGSFFIASDRYRIGGVLRRWFYLLSAGGVGVNACGAEYNVCGVGTELAARLLYNTVNRNWHTTANVSYPSFRLATIMSADDFPQIDVDDVIDAWYAVNVGPRPQGSYVIAVDNGYSPVVVTAGESFSYTSSFVGNQVHEIPRACYRLSSDNILSNDDITIGSEEVVLECGATSVTADLMIPANVQPGNFTLFIDADCDDEYDGFNPGNEVISIDIQVTGGEMPDLAVLTTSPAYEDFPPSVTRGQVINLSATVNNQGGNDAGNFWLKMFIRPVNQLTGPPSSIPVGQMGSVVGQRRIFGLDTDESYSVNFSFTVPQNYSYGEHIVFFVADAVSSGNGEVDEFNEDNNVGLGHFIVRQRTRPGGGTTCKFPCRPEKIGGDRTSNPYFTLSPNPVRSTSPVTIGYQPSLSEHLLVSITDMHGRKLQQYDLLPQQQSGRFQANTDGFPTGTYVVTLRSGDAVISQRLVVL